MNTWISVEDELPKCDNFFWDEEECPDLKLSDPVAVLLDNGDIHIATLNENIDLKTNKPTGEPYWFDENRRDEGDWLNKLVIKWCPLPKLPYNFIQE